MGNPQPPRGDPLIAVEEEIEIQGARAVPRLALSPSAGGALDFSEKGQEGPGGEPGSPHDDGVQEVRLRRLRRDGRGFVER